MFMEANPRLQVEHTITEMVAGVDLVELQLRLASGETLEAIDLPESPRPSGMVRINMETMLPDGSALPGGGVIERFNPPSGPGIRVDTFGYPGYSTNPRFDSLLAKVIVHHRQPDFGALLKRCYRALCEFDFAGVPTNLDFTKNLVQHPDIEALNYHTRFAETWLDELLVERRHPELFFPDPGLSPSQAGAAVYSSDPLAVLNYGKQTWTRFAPIFTKSANDGRRQPMPGAPPRWNVVAQQGNAPLARTSTFCAMRAPLSSTDPRAGRTATAPFRGGTHRKESGGRDDHRSGQCQRPSL